MRWLRFSSRAGLISQVPATRARTHTHTVLPLRADTFYKVRRRGGHLHMLGQRALRCWHHVDRRQVLLRQNWVQHWNLQRPCGVECEKGTQAALLPP